VSEGGPDNDERFGEFEVVNRKGLHARAAALLAQTASRFECDITVGRDDQRANAKSVMGVLLLCGSQGTRISVEARGVDASQAMTTLGALFASGFGEQD
jgi:phosphocarrier protein